MRTLRIPFLLLIFLSAGSPLSAADVTLAWDPNTESDLAGYKVYYGNSPGSYGTPVTIGTQTTYTVSGLSTGTWYFAVTAFNTAGLESGFSNVVTTTISANSTGSNCDINGDKLTNAVDIQVLINVILGTRSCPGSCDINKDTVVNAVDLQVLANVILGARSCP